MDQWAAGSGVLKCRSCLVSASGQVLVCVPHAWPAAGCMPLRRHEAGRVFTGTTVYVVRTSTVPLCHHELWLTPTSCGHTRKPSRSRVLPRTHLSVREDTGWNRAPPKTQGTSLAGPACKCRFADRLEHRLERPSEREQRSAFRTTLQPSA
jgi:hypothetical protein